MDTNSGKTIQLTIVEKEKIYLDAMQSFYYSGRELLSETEFQTLKEDLQWNGSPVIHPVFLPKSVHKTDAKI